MTPTNWWTAALYGLAAVSIILIMDPDWFMKGRPIFWQLGIGYPVGYGATGILIMSILCRDAQTRHAAFSRIVRSVLVMWATLFLWMSAIVVLSIIAMSRF